jgi:hypothetical protein
MTTHVAARSAKPDSQRASSVQPAGASRSIQRRCACGGLVTSVDGECDRCRSRRLQRQASERRKPAVRHDATGDALEREADLVAKQALRAEGPVSVTAAPEGIQRKCAACEADDELRASVQRKPTDDTHTLGSVEASAAVRAVRHGGTPLPAEVRSYFEPRLRHDFSRVRVHADVEAASAARAIDARAYTQGVHIAFASGEYAPGTPQGRELLAHELVHVVQQAGGARAEGSPVALSDTPGQVRRKSSNHPRDRCGETKADCGSASADALKPYHASDGFGGFSDELATIGKVILSPMASSERARLLRIACCQLEPEDATLLRDAFVHRRGTAGAAFGRFSTPTRCTLLAVLDERVAMPSKAQTRARIESIETEQRSKERAERQRQEDERRRAEAEAAQAKEDDENFRRAGVTDLLGAIMPAHMARYRIQYAPRIKNPYKRFLAGQAERAASVPMLNAATEVVARPILAAIRFKECLLKEASLKDAKKVVGKLGLRFLLALPTAFPAGVTVGVAKEIKNIAEQILHIIGSPIKFVKEILRLVEMFFSPQAEEFGCAIGSDLGEEFNKQLAEMADEGQFAIAYDLGKLAGPFLLNTLIALVAPEAVAFMKGTRFGKRLMKLMKDLGELEVLAKLRRAEKGGAKVEREIVAVEKEAAAIERRMLEAEKASAKEEGIVAPAQKAAAKAETVVKDSEKVLAPRRQGGGGHEVEVRGDGIHVCSPPPCPLLHVEYASELQAHPELLRELEEIAELRRTKPEEASRRSAGLQAKLEQQRVNAASATAPATSPAGTSPQHAPAGSPQGTGVPGGGLPLSPAEIKLNALGDDVARAKAALSTSGVERDALLKAGKKGTAEYKRAESAYEEAHRAFKKARNELESHQRELGITPRQLYERLRPKTPNSGMQKVADMHGPKDPVYGHIVSGKMSPDHIVPVSDIVKMKDFSKLPPDMQVEILNLADNTMGMDLSVNLAKGDRLWSAKPGTSRYFEGAVGRPPIDPDVRAKLIAAENRARAALERAISERLTKLGLNQP